MEGSLLLTRIGTHTSLTDSGEDIASDLFVVYWMLYCS